LEAGCHPVAREFYYELFTFVYVLFNPIFPIHNSHYKKAAEIDPDDPGLKTNLEFAMKQLLEQEGKLGKKK